MKNWQYYIFLILLIAGISCGNTKQQKSESHALIKTPYGNIRVKLYEKTKEHKKNFEKLAGEGFYNGLIFHRVINKFMIQGGDPKINGTESEIKANDSIYNYTIPAEIFPEYYHKRGVLAAARRGGPSNPEKRSSSSQFYIVQGEIFSPGQLDTLEMFKNQQLKNELVREQMKMAENKLQQFMANNDPEGFSLLVAEIREKVDSLVYARQIGFKFTEEQREIYSTIGGYPSLDGDYTIFGEVIEGMDVVDKIAAVETGQNDRPLENIKMEIELTD